MTSDFSRLVSLSLAVVACALPAAAQLSVVTVTPARETTLAPAFPTIRAQVSVALDPASVTAATVSVTGRWSGTMEGAVSLAAGGTEIVFEPDRPFLKGEMVTVALLRTIAAAGGGATLSGGHSWSFWVKPDAVPMGFTPLTPVSTRRPGEGSTRTYGGHAGDLDRDGFPDLALTNEDTHDVRVFTGDGCDGFSSMVVHPAQAGCTPSPAEGGDLNGDGWIDLAIGCTRSQSVIVYLNDGTGGYLPPAVYTAGQSVRGIALLDVEGDGDLDLVAACYTSQRLDLFLNDGSGVFGVPTPIQAGTQERGVAAADANGDGWMDIFVCNFSGAARILLNDGQGNFVAGAPTAINGRPWMIVTGDVNQDGHVDAITVDSNNPTASVLLGDGMGGLAAPSTLPTGAFPIAVDIGDLNGDGWLDVVSSNFSSSNLSVFAGGAAGFGPPSSVTVSRAGSCALLVDHDRDGDLDLIAIDEIADEIQVFRNDAPNVPARQPALCDARMRVDNSAGSGGLGVHPPHPIVNAGRVHLEVEGPAGGVAAILAGDPAVPGLFSPFGFANLVGVGEVIGPGLSLDQRGIAELALNLPPAMTVGSTFTLQSVVLGATLQSLRFTNPEQLQVVP